MAEQGVLIQRRFKTKQELEGQVVGHPGRVFIMQPSCSASEPMAYVRLLNQKQWQEEQAEKLRSAMWLGTASSSVPTVLLEQVTDATEHGTCYIRPKTKKELREQVARDPSSVYLEAMPTLAYEMPDYGGPVSEAPKNQRYAVVGPIPGLKHSWWAFIEWSERKGAWLVK